MNKITYSFHNIIEVLQKYKGYSIENSTENTKGNSLCKVAGKHTN